MMSFYNNFLKMFFTFLKYFFGSKSNSSTSKDESSSDCNRPAVEEFPSDFMKSEQRERGGVLVHFLIACYLVLALVKILFLVLD
jgi:hypothetical protein